MLKKSSFLFILILVTAGFGFRVFGLWQNYSFWIDEASSAGFARAILVRGFPVLASGYFPNNYLFHFYTMAFSFAVFGYNEFAARFPSVIFGVLTILTTYLLGKKIANKQVGLIAAFFVTFSIWEITMSRQARSYQILQFFYLTSILLFYRILDFYDQHKLNWSHLAIFIICVILSALTHMLGLIPLIAIFLYLICIRPDLIQAFWNKINYLIPSRLVRYVILFFCLGGLVVLLYYLNFFRGLKQVIWNTFESKFALFNHIKYYHSLFWRQYGLISFLGFLGLFWLTIAKFKQAILLVIILGIHLGLILFRFPEAYTRYAFVVFPLFLIFFSFALWQIWEWSFSYFPKKLRLINNIKTITLAGLIFLIVINGYKFTLLPKQFYSVNSEMREVPEPDFKTAYQYIIQKDSSKNFVLVDTRPDASFWYFGEGYPNYYLGGQERQVSQRLSKGFIRDEASGAYYITSMDSLVQAINQNKKGFIVLEQATVEYSKIDPEIINYIQDNLKKEIRVDKIKPNTDGDWPIEIYSWGY